MTDEQIPRSGSRWEPAPDDASVLPPATPPVPPVAAAPAAPAPPAPPEHPWARRVRGNGGLVGAALALVLFTGVGGYALGHTTGGPDRFGIVGEQVPGGGLPAPGTGQLPPPHGDDDGSGTRPGSGDDGGSDDGAAQPGSTL